LAGRARGLLGVRPRGSVAADDDRQDRFGVSVARMVGSVRQPMHRRSMRALGLAAVVGVVTGSVVAAFDLLAEDMLDLLLEQPLVVQAFGPLVGLLLAAAALRWLAGGATPATADECIRNFHEPTTSLSLKPVIGRMVAALATLGFGGSLGYEGPAIYGGAAIGTGIQRRLHRWFSADDRKVLMVAGAAAGVAAVFKAPVTGLVFALEVPYQEDLARRMLLPAGIASAASYVVFAAAAGTEPLLPIFGAPPFDLRDLGGAAAIGLIAGVCARVAVLFLRWTKTVGLRAHPALRALGAGLVLAGLFAGGRALGVDNPTLGPGYDTMEWALDPAHSVWVIAALAAIRLAATGATLGGGGVAGLFIPLVVQGALLGRIVSGVIDPANRTLFPVLGIAAFLGAGYRVPLASVVFVAEFTGRPGFIVPGLIAAVVAQLPMGERSMSPYQVAARRGHLERRLRLPVAQVLESSARTVPSDATVSELFWQHLVGQRQLSVPVVDGNEYQGMVLAADLADVDRTTWGSLTVSSIMRSDVPTVDLSSQVEEAIHRMEDADVDRLAVTDGSQFIGTVSLDDIVRLDDVIDRTRYGTSTAG
jgi:CIC family chloride channel protein